MQMGDRQEDQKIRRDSKWCASSTQTIRPAWMWRLKLRHLVHPPAPGRSYFNPSHRIVTSNRVASNTYTCCSRNSGACTCRR